MIEDVQKQFTRHFYPHLTYIDRLKHFGSKSPDERRILFDLYELFHVIHMHDYHKLNNHFVFTHSLRFSLNFCLVYCRKKYQRHFGSLIQIIIIIIIQVFIGTKRNT